MQNGNSTWGTLKICRIVFGGIGVMFSALGIIFALEIDTIAASPRSHGNISVLPWVFGGIGLLFLIVFAAMSILSAKWQRERSSLIDGGKYIIATVVEVRQNLLVKINRRHPSYVICEWEDPFSGQKQRFKSDDTLQDLSCLPGSRLRVYINSADPQKYYVELFQSSDL